MAPPGFAQARHEAPPAEAVLGMPREAIELGAAEQVLPLRA